MSSNKYIFWSNDPTILYKNEKYLEFIPTEKMSRIDQLNAVTRFCIYFLILAIITKQSNIWIQLPLLAIIFTYILFISYDADSEGKYNEMTRMKIQSENDTNENFISSNNTDNKNNTDNTNNKNPIISIEAGIYDEKGKLVTGPYECSKCDKKNQYKYSYDEIDEYKKSTCRRPSESNPFMNPTVNDFGAVSPPQACNIDDDDIDHEIHENFNKNLFTEVSDLFERNNSQRQFYSIPGSAVPDTVGFANWLYSPEGTCKTDQMKCMSYNDLRYNR